MINFNDFDVEEERLSDKTFVKFLRYNGIYDEFMLNLNREKNSKTGFYGVRWFSIKTFCDDIRIQPNGVKDYINEAFDWSKTNEGFDFWRKYSTMWVWNSIKRKIVT